MTALGLRTRRGLHLSKQTFSRLVRNAFYSGWIVKGETRVRGNHDPLISEEMFAAVQARLSGHAPREIEKDDFPLRGFVRCCKCSKNLTAGWVTGRSKKYARYWCWTKDCGDVQVSASAIEGRLVNLMALIQPEARLLARIPTLAARSWEGRKERIAADAKALVRRLEAQGMLNERAITTKLMGELTAGDFRTIKASIDTETTAIQRQIAALDQEQSSMDDLLKQTQTSVINFGGSWKDAIPARKREIQIALFPNGLEYGSELKFFYPSNQSLVQLFRDALDSISLVGVPDGI